jgi:hypothetical protein
MRSKRIRRKITRRKSNNRKRRTNRKRSNNRRRRTTRRRMKGGMFIRGVTKPQPLGERNVNVPLPPMGGVAKRSRMSSTSSGGGRPRMSSTSSGGDRSSVTVEAYTCLNPHPKDIEIIQINYLDADDIEIAKKYDHASSVGTKISWMLFGKDAESYLINKKRWFPPDDLDEGNEFSHYDAFDDYGVRPHVVQRALEEGKINPIYTGAPRLNYEIKHSKNSVDSVDGVDHYTSPKQEVAWDVFVACQVVPIRDSEKWGKLKIKYYIKMK